MAALVLQKLKARTKRKALKLAEVGTLGSQQGILIKTDTAELQSEGPAGTLLSAASFHELAAVQHGKAM
jgi:hypothetical protein